jgi:DNA-binding beta-propeller fold protein YncE
MSVTTVSRTTLVPCLIALSLCSQRAASQQLYRLESAVVLPGANPSWDYLALDPARSRLFISRRADGVTVYDVGARHVTSVIGNSEGANSTALAEEAGRGYTANEDGSTTIFDLSSLRTIDRVKFGADADAAVYEPATKQMVFTMGDSKALAFLDAKTGAIVGRLSMPSKKLDGAAADGGGNLFVAERDRNAIARIDARRRRMTAEWKIPGCQAPTGLAIDRANARLFIGCRGSHPVLAVLDLQTGKEVARHEIGRGNDGVAYDAEAHTVYTSNGVDANLVIFDQIGPNAYRLAEALTTRPFARTMALDPRTKKLYLVTAEGTVDVSKAAKTSVSAFYPNRYFADTFTLLTYSRR